MRNRVHSLNRPLFELPPTHPAVRALIAHADCRERCVGKEIPWLGKEAEAFDQEWYSEIEVRTLSFSSFAYEFISYDLVLDGWIERKPGLSADEKCILESLPKLRGLMDECEVAAGACQNSRVLDGVAIVRHWLDALENAIVYRMQVDGIAHT
jgi:hypothetical protein